MDIHRCNDIYVWLSEEIPDFCTELLKSIVVVNRSQACRTSLEKPVGNAPNESSAETKYEHNIGQPMPVGLRKTEHATSLIHGPSK